MSHAGKIRREYGPTYSEVPFLLHNEKQRGGRRRERNLTPYELWKGNRADNKKQGEGRYVIGKTTSSTQTWRRGWERREKTTPNTKTTCNRPWVPEKQKEGLVFSCTSGPRGVVTKGKGTEKERGKGEMVNLRRTIVGRNRLKTWTKQKDGQNSRSRVKRRVQDGEERKKGTGKKVQTSPVVGGY